MAKKSTNDKAILDLKEKIAEKKAALKSSERFNPKTNCSLEMDGKRVNLHTLNDAAELGLLLVKLVLYKNMEMELQLDKPIVLNNHTLPEWIADVRARLANVNRNTEEARLKAYEAQLHELLSAEKKTELLIDEIGALVK